VALQLRDGSDADSVQVYGRGLLHLTVLIENMRREGFELQVGPPQVLFQEEGGVKTEPYELVEIELPEEHAGSVIDLLGQRKGVMMDMGAPNADGLQVIQYEVPTRGMVGVKTKMLNSTRGLGVMTSTFAGYKPYAGDFGQRTRGNLLSTETGRANNHGLDKAQTRGQLFVAHNDDVFFNQIVGIHSSAGDLAVNICRKKELTNMRASGKEEGYNIFPPVVYTLEEAVEYVIDGEFVEITPEHIRMGAYQRTSRSGKKI
jgi:GTP-binding protein